MFNRCAYVCMCGRLSETIVLSNFLFEKRIKDHAELNVECERGKMKLAYLYFHIKDDKYHMDKEE